MAMDTPAVESATALFLSRFLEDPVEWTLSSASQKATGTSGGL
jgi:hypothetical protein